jgi:hypothetical protein
MVPKARNPEAEKLPEFASFDVLRFALPSAVMLSHTGILRWVETGNLAVQVFFALTDPQAVEKCLQFVEAASPFRFCFLAVGSPQQESIAHMLKTRGVARGLVLCVGGSLNFLTGNERRAPMWVRRLALEWLFRLLQDPSRLAQRYLVRGPRIFIYLRRAKFELRKPALTAEELS